MTSIAIIPARGGSVRLPRKNIRDFMGKPIIAYSIDVAEKFGFDSIAVSTDDDEIAAVAKEYGASVMWREPDDGTKGTQEVAADVLKASSWHFDFACVIYPCAPLIEVDDLRQAFTAVNTGSRFAFGVGMDPLRDAGAFYFGLAEAFKGGYSLIQPGTAMIPLPNDRVCDINTLEDFERAERMYAALKGAA
jgi:pseudaminic acid cytidylyltransferase